LDRRESTMLGQSTAVYPTRQLASRLPAVKCAGSCHTGAGRQRSIRIESPRASRYLPIGR
jgi:hypothetical protein